MWEKVASPDVPQELGPCRLLQVSAGLNSVWALTKDGQVHTWKRFLRHAKKSLQFSHVYLRYWPSVRSRCSVKRLNFRASRIGPSACSGSQSEHRFGFVLRAGVVNHIIGTLLSINDGGSETSASQKLCVRRFEIFRDYFNSSSPQSGEIRWSRRESQRGRVNLPPCRTRLKSTLNLVISRRSCARKTK